MPSPLILLIASAIIFAPLCSWLALQRGRSWAAWFVLGSILGPLAAGLLYLAPPGECPTCGAGVHGWPRTCPTCGARLDGKDVAPDPAVASAPVGRSGPEPGAARDSHAPDGAILASGLYVGGSGPLHIGDRYLLALVGPELHVLGPMGSAPGRVAARLRLPFSEVSLSGDRLAIGDGGGTGRNLAFSGVYTQRRVDLKEVLRQEPAGGATADGLAEPAAPSPTSPVRSVTARPQTGLLASDLASPVVIATVLVIGLAVTLVGTQVMAGSGGPTSPPPSSVPSPTATSGTTTSPAIRGALTAVLVIDQRLALRRTALEAAIDPPDASQLAAILRTMNGDLTAGRDAAERLRSTPATAGLGTDLIALYDAVLERNDETLRASVRNVEAYVGGGADVIVLLGAVPALDDRIADALAGRPAPGPTPTAVASMPASAAPSPTRPPTAEPTDGDPSATPSPSSTGGPSLVRNPGFEAGLSGWRLELTGDAEATVALDPEGGSGSTSARVDITRGSLSRSAIALTTDAFDLVSGRSYLVEVALRARAVRDVRIRLIDGAGQTITARIETVGPTWATLSFTTTALTGDTGVHLAIDAGRAEASVWVDNVVVRLAAPD